MQKQRERRKEPRKKLMTFTSVYDLHKRLLLGHIRDLTPQGVLIIGERELVVNSKTTLAFELPGGLPGITATYMKISARVARCESDESSQTYKIGFEFLNVKPEQVEIFQALLERYHFHH